MRVVAADGQAAATPTPAIAQNRPSPLHSTPQPPSPLLPPCPPWLVCLIKKEITLHSVTSTISGDVSDFVTLVALHIALLGLPTLGAVPGDVSLLLAVVALHSAF